MRSHVGLPRTHDDMTSNCCAAASLLFYQELKCANPRADARGAHTRSLHVVARSAHVILFKFFHEPKIRYPRVDACVHARCEACLRVDAAGIQMDQRGMGDLGRGHGPKRGLGAYVMGDFGRSHRKTH